VNIRVDSKTVPLKLAAVLRSAGADAAALAASDVNVPPPFYSSRRIRRRPLRFLSSHSSPLDA